MKAYVKSERDKRGIRTIEFGTPAHNSLPGNILAELKEAIIIAGNDTETKLILLKSGGDRTFCAGANFEELVSIQDEAQGKEFFMGFARVINACRTCGKIVIGRIQGKAVGGGVGVAAACDYAVASKYASVRLSELELGIGPFVIGPAVSRRVGKTHFAKMALTPHEWQTAEWAKDKGLYQEVFPSNEQVDTYVEDLCAQSSKYNPEALSLMKEIIWKGSENWDTLLEKRAEMSGRLVLSDFTKQALKKVQEKMA